jgi:hypothetical protein
VEDHPDDRSFSSIPPLFSLTSDLSRLFCPAVLGVAAGDAGAGGAAAGAAGAGGAAAGAAAAAAGAAADFVPFSKFMPAFLHWIDEGNSNDV